MFTSIPTNPQDFFKTAFDYYKMIPKTEDEIKETLNKIKSVFEAETENTKQLFDIMKKASTGDASVNELATAGKTMNEMMVAARFATVMAMPGSVFMLPALVEFAKKYNVEIIPASVKKEFNL